MSQHATVNETALSVGDTIRVHQEITEGEKSRTQIFEGIVIAIKGRENGRSFTVRRMSVGGVGVEKIFPVNLASIKKIEVKREGSVRRSKLYYLRDRIGKAATKVKEKATVFETASK